MGVTGWILGQFHDLVITVGNYRNRRCRISSLTPWSVFWTFHIGSQGWINKRKILCLQLTVAAQFWLLPPPQFLPWQTTESSFSFFNNFVCFWLHWVFIATPQPSLVVARRRCSLVAVCELLFGFSHFAEQALGTWASVVAAHELSSCGGRT